MPECQNARIRRFTSSPSPSATGTSPVSLRAKPPAEAELILERYAATSQKVSATIRFLSRRSRNPQSAIRNATRPGFADQRPRRHGAAVRGSGPREFQIRLRARREPESRRAGGPPRFREAPPRLGERRRFSFAARFQKSRGVSSRFARRLEFCGQRRRRPHGGNRIARRNGRGQKHHRFSFQPADGKTRAAANNCPPTPTCA